MNSRLHPSFRRDFAKLPRDVQQRARQSYARFKLNPNLPGLYFKLVNSAQRVWSVRITDSYRALGIRRDADNIVWFFIGPHDEYEKILKSI